MGHCIFKVTTDKGEELYGRWSTIVDAPITSLMPLEELRKVYLWEFGQSSMADFRSSVELANMYGTSWGKGYTIQDLLENNRAGKNGRCMKTIRGLIRKYKADF